MLSCLAVGEKLYQVGLLRGLTVPRHIKLRVSSSQRKHVVLFGSGEETVSGRFVKRVDCTTSYKTYGIILPEEAVLSCLAVGEKLYQVGLLRGLTVPRHIKLRVSSS